jgi:glycerol-3-phosphate acyltransferase PlsY
VVFFSTVLLYLLQPSQALPFLAGAALISVNFWLLSLLWRRILGKNSVATTIGIVVIKYAILAVVLYLFVKEWKLPLMPLFMGLTTLAASFVIAAVLNQREAKGN